MRHRKTIDRARKLRSNLTDAERTLWRELRKPPFNGYKFRRQHPIGRYVVDFASVSAALVIELDGGQHAIVYTQDEARTRSLINLGFRAVRFWNNEVNGNLDGVLAAIKRALAQEQRD